VSFGLPEFEEFQTTKPQRHGETTEKSASVILGKVYKNPDGLTLIAAWVASN